MLEGLRATLPGSQQQIDVEYVPRRVEIAVTKERIAFLRSARAAAPYSVRLFSVEIGAS